MDTDKYEEFADNFRSSSPEEIAEDNRREVQRAIEEHTTFLHAFNEGRCYVCDRWLDSFDEQRPCVHWLLNPNGFKKKHFPLVYSRFGFFQIQSFLRWVASVGRSFRNINDWIEEHSGKKEINLTIRYSDLEWSFSCSSSDLTGHLGKPTGAHPHYHFQMAFKGNTIVKYNDFHVPFTEEDLIKLYMTKRHPDLVKHHFLFGEGMQDLMSQPVDKLLSTARAIDESNDATLHIQTIIRGKPGEGISAEDVNAIVREANAAGVTVASLAHKLDVSRLTLIEPGSGVPQPKERHGRRMPKFVGASGRDSPVKKQNRRKDKPSAA